MLAGAARSLVVADAQADPAFAMRAATRDLGIGAYSGVPLRHADGRLYGTLCTLHPQARVPEPGELELLALAGRLIMQMVDREVLRTAARAAEERSAELTAILEQIPDGVIALDREGNIRLINEVGRRMAVPLTGDNRPVPERAKTYGLRDATGRYLTPAQTPLGRALQGEDVENVDLLARGSAEAEDRYVRASAVPLRDADGSLTGAVAVFADVTRERTLMQHLAASEERLRRTYDAMACGIIVLDREGCVVDVNVAARQILGLGVSEPVDIWALRARVNAVDGVAPVTPRAKLEVLDAWDPARAVVIAYRHPDGTERWLHLDAMPVPGPSGGQDSMVLSFIDVTDRTRAETALRASEERVRTVVSGAPVILFAIDRDGVFTLAEGRGLAAIGQRPGQAVGACVFEVYRAQPHILAHIQRALAGEAHTGVAAVDGVVFETRYTPLYDADGAVSGVIGVATDITERQRMEEELRRQALHDALTGLPNRAFLRQRVSDELAAAEQNGATLALCLLDLDHFKDVNDTFGHYHGDLLLQQVAGRLGEALRPRGMIGRLGGDEFAVLLPVADAEGASAVAATIGDALATPFTVEGQTLYARASIGIALAPEHGHDAATLLRRADVAMYAAKHEGRGYAIYAPEQDAALPERLSLIADLRRAVGEGGLLLHYQPKWDLHTGRIAGVEALARWPHQERGFVPPDQFIPLAEGMGLMGSLTDWVLETAIGQCRAWRDAGHALSVAVNISAATLHDPDLPTTIERLLRAYAVPGSDLRLEVTESAVMADPERGGVVLRRLAALGLGISVDDYGTGYSSLAYLKRLPIDELKIDRSFVWDMGRDDANAAIVASTVGLGHTLGLRVVAEGVEDQETHDALAAIGCDAVQGYYLGRPMPAADLMRRLSELESGVTSGHALPRRNGGRRRLARVHRPWVRARHARCPWTQHAAREAC